MAKLPAAIITGTIARPSRPSVRLTALEEPIITSAPNSGNASPSGMIRSLNTGTATLVAMGEVPSRISTIAAMMPMPPCPSSFSLPDRPPLERLVSLR